MTVSVIYATPYHCTVGGDTNIDLFRQSKRKTKTMRARSSAMTIDDDDDDIQTVTAEWICKKLVISPKTLGRIIAGDNTFPATLSLPGGPRRWRKAEFLRWLRDRTK